ncbi:MAG: hypothetical protein H7175_11615, partial [Burkholderiales bacterium]|nr:hypothetical protein [Anaerolineae bacterium]
MRLSVRAWGWGALLCALFVGMFVLAHIRLGVSYLEDDAYITYRYAANLARGEGLVYNPGQHVLGTTTPGYAALLGAAGVMFGADTIPAASRIINALCMLIAGGCAYLIAQRLTRSPLVAALALGLPLLSYETLYGSLAGMESPLFLALLGVALLALVYGRTGPAALAAGMLALVRPEGA